MTEKLETILDDSSRKLPVRDNNSTILNHTSSRTSLSIRPGDPLIAKDAFRKQSLGGKVETLAAVPTDAMTFERIFSRQPSRAELTEIESLSLPSGAHIADKNMNFESYVKNSKAGVLAIVGHNDAGSFVFADGTMLRLEEMGRVCRTAGKLCVFVSCESSAHLEGNGLTGLQHEVTFHDAVRIAEDIVKRLPHETTPDRLADMLPTIVASAERSNRTKYHVEYVVKRVGVAIAVVGIVVIIDCALDSKKRCIH